uniref:Uncharacterized protein n=1 Tax=Glossina austeni TaxID=7395 RepID=A0A1A9UPA7_GLOAU
MKLFLDYSPNPRNMLSNETCFLWDNRSLLKAQVIKRRVDRVHIASPGETLITTPYSDIENIFYFPYYFIYVTNFYEEVVAEALGQNDATGTRGCRQLTNKS